MAISSDAEEEDPACRFAVGDPLRSLMLHGNHFTGAHTNNPQYFTVTDQTLRLKSVCWLAVGGTLKQVPRGEWEAVLHVKVNNLDFDGDWRVGVGVGHRRDWALKDANATWDDKCEAALVNTGVRPAMFRNKNARGRNVLVDGRKPRGNALLERRLKEWYGVSRPASPRPARCSLRVAAASPRRAARPPAPTSTSPARSLALARPRPRSRPLPRRTKLGFGKLRLVDEFSDVRFEMGGGSSSWCSGTSQARRSLDHPPRPTSDLHHSRPPTSDL